MKPKDRAGLKVEDSSTDWVWLAVAIGPAATRILMPIPEGKGLRALVDFL